MKRYHKRLEDVGYQDSPEARVLDLRADVPCVPVLQKLDYHMVQRNPELHRHEGCVEFIYCRRGELSVETVGKSFKLYPGMLMVAQPTLTHRLRDLPRGARFYGLYLQLPEPGEQMLNLSTQESAWFAGKLKQLPVCLNSIGNDIRSHFRRLFYLYDVLALSTPERSFRLRVAVTNLLMGIMNCETSAKRGEKDDPIGIIADEMREHPEREFHLWELAQRFELSEETIRVRFRQFTGVPPHAYLMACRIDAAKRRLVEAKHTIIQIASEFKFSSSQNFATQFRLATGVTPTAWRAGQLVSTKNQNHKE